MKAIFLSFRALGLGALLLTGAAESFAAKDVFQRSKPHVSVGCAGRVELRDPALTFGFSADIQVAPNGAVSGGMVVGLGDASVRFYRPMGGTVLEGNSCLVFFLGGQQSGELDPTDVAIAIFAADPARSGALLVQLQAPRIFPHALEFRLGGDLRLTPADDDSRRPQAHPWFIFHYRPQQVLLHGSDLRIGFSAHALARQDRSIGGRIALDLRDGLAPVAFEPLLGALVPEAATGPGYIVILMVSNAAPPELENLVVGIVRPDPALPGCDIWDFSSNNVTRRGELLRLVFHAEGWIHIVRGAP